MLLNGVVKIFISNFLATAAISTIAQDQLFFFYFRSQYSEGPATGHLDTGFSWFPCA